MVGRIGKTIRLYLRSLDTFEMVPLAGTDDASNPFFSPDGRWLGFFADSKLKKVSVDGGAPVALADARTPRGEAWLADDSILITPNNNVGLSRVPVIGGAPQPFSTLATGEMSHRWPRALEGGAAVLFTVWNDTGWDPARVAVQRSGEREHRVLVEGGGYARSMRDPATGRTYLLYARAEGVVAAPFDVDRLAVTGAPVPIVDNVITNLSGGAHFDIGGGTLAYIPGSLGEADRDLVWVTLDGTATPARRVPQMSQDFSLSPDGTRILRNNTVGNRDVWIEDLSRGTSTRVTSTTESFGAVWSPDAQWIVYARGAPIRNLVSTQSECRIARRAPDDVAALAGTGGHLARRQMARLYRDRSHLQHGHLGARTTAGRHTDRNGRGDRQPPVSQDDIQRKRSGLVA